MQLACCWARLQYVPARPVILQRRQDGAAAPPVSQIATVMALSMKGAAWAASSVYAEDMVVSTLTVLGLWPSYGRMEERMAACLAVHGRQKQRAEREGEWRAQGSAGGQGG